MFTKCDLKDKESHLAEVCLKVSLYAQFVCFKYELWTELCLPFKL